MIGPTLPGARLHGLVRLFPLETTGVVRIAPALRVRELWSIVEGEAPGHRLDQILGTLEHSLIRHLSTIVAELGGREVDFVVNTHWHFDHTDGNPLLGSAGSLIVSQVNSRLMMTERQLINLTVDVVAQPPSPPEGLPVITYDDRMQIHFNGEQIDLLHFGPAHTTGDGAVVFRGRNVAHMGDVFNTGGYPFIDADNGGDLDGIILFCEAILREINEDTVVIPGHGPK